MPRRPTPKGTCTYCQTEISRAGATKHLDACSKRQEVIDASNAQGGKAETLFHLRAQDAGRGDFWLHLEMRGSATLGDLDYYLRGIWLECCGHLSQFSVGGWRGEEIPMSRKVHDVFQPGNDLTHIYDFGTSSETLIKVVGARQGKPTAKRPIALMARNAMPEETCIECERPAKWLCEQCMYEDDRPGLLCDEHAETHPHEDYGDPVSLLNSPRVGMCGYAGPADPPY